MSRDGAAIVVLAGGEGRRIGGGKPLRLLAGERLIDRALRWARQRSDGIAVAVRSGSQAPNVDAQIIADNPQVAGPFAGLMSALRYGREQGRDRVLTIAADMPFLPDNLLQRLDGAIGAYACALASSEGRLHPVCGLWRASALDQINSYLETGRRSLKGFAEQIGFVVVEWPGGLSDPFFNINCIEDLAQAQRRLEG